MPDANPVPTDQRNPQIPAAQFRLKIDREQFDWSQPSINGQELRDLPNPPVGNDRDLYEEVPGGDDKLIEASTTVVLMEHGETRFFTAPHHVTPGL